MAFASTVALTVLSVTCGARSDLVASDVEADSPHGSSPDASLPDASSPDALLDSPPDAPLDAEPSSICVVPDAGSAGPDAGICELTLIAIEVVKSSPECFIDEVVSSLTGHLVFPCGGGAATVTFGDRVFEGSVVGGILDVCTGTEFPWDDGCQWQSAQRITGQLEDGIVDFTYAEQPKAGQSGCVPRCSAKGTLAVQ